MEGKQEVKEDPSLQFAIRSKAGYKFFSGTPDVKPTDFKGEAHNGLHFSQDGSIVAVVDTTKGFTVFDVDSKKIVQQWDVPNVTHVYISPKNTFILSWQRPIPDQPADNVIAWEISSGKQVYSFVQKNLVLENWPYIKWSKDESISGRMVSNEVQFYAGKDIGKINTRLKLADIRGFEISGGEAPFKIAGFVPEKKGAPASIKVFKFPSMDMVASKSFYKAQEVQLLWNSTGTAVLAATHTEVDKSGKSYYGESGLHYASADGKIECQVPLKKEGQVHDVQWSPNGQFFAVSYGFMPAQTTIFDAKCNPVADLGVAARNSIRWSPNSRLLCVAGFGNLAGEFDIWDAKKLKKLGSATAEFTSFIQWAPDSRRIVTGILFPRMRVSNGFRIFSYDGTLLHREDVEEIYQVTWRPNATENFSNRPPSPRLYSGTAKKETEVPVAPLKPAKYVHPNAQGRTVAALHKEEPAQSGPSKYKKPNDRGNENPVGFTSPSASKNAKRNQKRKEKKDVDIKEENPKEEEKEEVKLTKEEAEKKVKALQKKLRQIEQLKEQQKTGKQLDPAQLEKLNGEAVIVAEISKLSLI
eukprot:TRINITY_DN147_c0_g1_i1.p1 TRINITY_DN147_c0_g1~~TRINITY_DN147_c0_g1_i1.p1  ORF type:complete len:597 (+),score=210.21 TRINITY_DN147_c0_g1_i1:44-1792(+)